MYFVFASARIVISVNQLLCLCGICPCILCLHLPKLLNSSCALANCCIVAELILYVYNKLLLDVHVHVEYFVTILLYFSLMPSHELHYPS